MSNLPPPCFSIIIPCYNKASYIEQTVESVIAQNCQDWECIIIDDGSTDNSVEIIKKMAAMDRRIQTVFKINSGVADTRNIGLLKASGKYILFLDADDYIAKEKLEITLKEFEANSEIKVVYSNYSFVFASDPHKKRKKSTFRTQIKGNPYLDMLAHWDETLIVPIHSPVYDRQLLLENNIAFDKTLKNKEDWDFLLQVAAVTDQFSFVNADLVTYYVVGQSRSSINNSLMIEGVDQLYTKHFDNKNIRVIRAIAYNLRYRIVRNRIVRGLGKKEPLEKLSLYEVSKMKSVRIQTYLMMPLAIIMSGFKFVKKF